MKEEILRAFSNFYGIGKAETKLIEPLQLSREELTKYVGKYQFKEQGEYFLDVFINENGQLVLFDPNDGMKLTYVAAEENLFIDEKTALEATFGMDTVTGEVLNMDYNGVYTFVKVE